MSSHKDSLEAMRRFAEANLPSLCSELLEWHAECVLRDGLTRQLADMCTFDTDNKLRQAERTIELAALRFCARSPK